jgi:hypothetical protein
MTKHGQAVEISRVDQLFGAPCRFRDVHREEVERQHDPQREVWLYPLGARIEWTFSPWAPEEGALNAPKSG